MRFRPIKQFNAILQQEYFEPTLSWAFRVMLALNVPVVVLYFFHGFSPEVIWAAFGGYMISLVDYRGLHYKKIIIQSLETGLIITAAFLGMNVSSSLWLSVLAMLLVGMFAAFIRNWSDYGPSIGVAFGFFFLFGLANPVSLEQSIVYVIYLFAGACWGILITILSFPFQSSNPVKRSVARVWKANTDFLDAIVEEQNEGGKKNLTEKELAMRAATSHSVNLFARRAKKDAKVQHYDLLIDLRRTAVLFGATLSSIHEQMEVVKKSPFAEKSNITLYKTLSALAQASARVAIVIYTSRPEDFTMAKVRVQRCGIALDLLKETMREEKNPGVGLIHFIDTIEKACEYLELSIQQLEQKLNIRKTDYFESYRLTFNNFVAGMRSWVIVDFLRNLVNVNSEQFRYALRVSVGLCLGVFLFKFFKIDHGYWIPLTMIIVIQPYYGATRKKSIERIIGTLAGIVLGGLIMLLKLPVPVFMGMLILVSFFVAYFLRNNYKVGVFFVTIMMVVLMQISEEGSLRLIGWRVISTLLGSGLAVLAGYVFWPVWEKERFPALVVTSLERSKLYLNRVMNYYNNELQPHETWYPERRRAEEANNNAFACAQRMFEEPENIRQKVDNSFALVGMIIRIAREITSIALLTEEKRANSKIRQLEVYTAIVNRILDEFIASVNERKYPVDIQPLVHEMKTCLNAIVFKNNEQLSFIKSELEKIVFELEAMHRMIPKTF